jgi:hypothetical protein
MGKTSLGEFMNHYAGFGCGLVGLYNGFGDGLLAIGLLADEKDDDILARDLENETLPNVKRIVEACTKLMDLRG